MLSLLSQTIDNQQINSSYKLTPKKKQNEFSY